MIELLRKGLTRRGRQVRYIAGCIALIVLVLGCVPSLLAAYGQETALAQSTQTGEQHGIWFDVEEAQLSAARDAGAQAASMTCYGSFSLVGTGRRVTVGTMGEDARAMGRFTLTEGDWPTATDEILLENHVRYLLPDTAQLGSVITLRMGRDTRRFVICGFIDDYRTRWDLPDGADQLPCAFVCDGSVGGRASVCHGLIRLPSTPVDWQASLDTLAAQAGFAGQTAYNSALYDTVYAERIAPVGQYGKLFGWILYGIGGLLIWIVAEQSLAEVRSHLPAAAEWQVLTVMLLNAALGCLPGMVLGRLGARLLLWAAAAGWDVYAVFAPGALWYTGAVLLGGTVFTWLCGIGMPHILPMPASRFGTYARGVRRAALILAICVICALGLGVGEDVAHRGRHEQDTAYLHFAAAAPQDASVLTYGDYTLTVRSRWSLRSVYNGFSGFKGVAGISAQADAQDLRVLQDTPSAYWQQVSAAAGQATGEDTTGQPFSPPDVQAYAGLQVIVVDRWNRDALAQAYPALQFHAAFSEGQGVLFAPPVGPYTSGFGAGQDMMLGSLYHRGMQRIPAAEDIRLRTEHIRLSAVYHERFVLDTGYTRYESDLPVLLISAETAFGLKGLRGIDAFTVYLDADLPPLAYTVVESIFDDVAYGMQDSVVFKSREEAAFYERFARVMGLCGGLVCAACAAVAAWVLHREGAARRPDRLRCLAETAAGLLMLFLSAGGMLHWLRTYAALSVPHTVLVGNWPLAAGRAAVLLCLCGICRPAQKNTCIPMENTVY